MGSMLEIKVQTNSSVDKEELVKLYTKQRRNEIGRELGAEEIYIYVRYIEQMFNSFVTKSFLGYDSDELIGWLGIKEAFPSTMLFYEYHPMVVSNANKKQIAQELIQESIEYATEKNIGNIRVFVEVTSARMNRFLESEQYYLRAGMKKTHTVLCMENKLSNRGLREIVVDSDYYIEPVKSQSIKSLKDCYNRIFAESYDNFTNSLDDKERIYWDFFQRGEFNEASIVIRRENELVALIVAVDHGDYVELGPIGVVPNNRGKKLGKVLLEKCLSNLIKQGKLECYLEVDETNTPAINLYAAYGFFEVSKKHGFLLRIDNNELVQK